MPNCRVHQAANSGINNPQYNIIKITLKISVKNTHPLLIPLPLQLSTEESTTILCRRTRVDNFFRCSKVKRSVIFKVIIYYPPTREITTLTQNSYLEFVSVSIKT